MIIPPQVAAAGIGAAASLIGGKRQRKAARRQQGEMLKLQKEQQALLEKQKDEFREIEFSNPYAGMENPFEDLRVATGAADFQAEQGAQQRANILGQLRGAAGTSGIAGLAQSMANQGQLQTQQISAGLQQQEVANELARAKGASFIDMQERTGETMVQQAESSRQATLLGMQYGQTAGANEAYQQSALNTQQAQASANQMQADAFGNLAKSTKGLKWEDFTG
tara:strand:+ start:457 stop:1125 length:669 start_codon:yes stop_codon:yes gene_type:complete